MTTQVAPAAMSTARLAGPARSMVPTVNTEPVACTNEVVKLWVVASSMRAYPRMKQPAHRTSWAMRATGAVEARMRSLPS